MANVSTHFSASIVDSLGVKKSTDVYLDIVDTTTLAALNLLAGTWLTDLDAITDGRIDTSQVIIKPTIPCGLKAAAAAGALAAKTAQISFSATGTPKLWGQAVPAVAAGSIVSGKVPNSGSMATYTAFLLGGSFTNPDNQALVALRKTAIGDRSARKQQQPLTSTKF